MPTPGTGTGPGFSSPLPAGGASVNASGQSTLPPGVPPEISSVYQPGIDSAQAQYQTAVQHYQVAQDAFTAASSARIPDDGAIAAAERNLTNARTTVEQAGKNLAEQHSRQAAAIDKYVGNKYSDPNVQDYYKGLADRERAQADLYAKQSAAYTATSAADQTKTMADANEAVARAASLGILSPAQADQARATAADAQARARQADALTPGLVAKGQAEATIAGASAAVAPDVAQATLQKTQADADKARLEVQALQRQYDSTTDEQAKQAVGLELQQKQTALQAAQTQLEAAQKLMPLSVAQAGANVEATQAGTQKGLLGNLYGLQDRIKTIADALRSGQISDPAQAQQQLQNYINTTIAGTTPYEAQTTALSAETTRRQQDYTLAGNQMSVLGSFGGSALGNMLQANRDAPAGSTAMAQSYGGIMGAMMGAFQGMNPQVPMNSPLLQSMSNMGGVGAASAPVAAAPVGSAAPTTTITPDGTVTIQHASSDPSMMATGIMGPSQGGAGPLPAMLTGTQMATPDHVSALWANDPNLNPGNAVATRTAYGDLNRGM